MKITDLHIYGYGKLSDLKISSLQDLQVIYGENEAGKSTIMAFIHSILFGFPTKQQSELRYEPKEGAKYGGRLTAIFPERGRAVIERVKGKASGDVSVHLEDGTRGDEELLTDLLHDVDKSRYQSIFSFNIHGLQNVHQMKSEELGKFLFSAGALGTDQLLRAESTIQKELENRFKPNGKKPSINEKLKEIKLLHEELKKAKLHNEQYWILLKETEALECDIAGKQKEQLVNQNKLSKLDAWKQIKPLIEEEKTLKAEREQFNGIHFPIDGITRLDRLDEIMKPIEGQIASISQRMSTLKGELEGSAPDELLLSKEPEIITAVESLSLLEKLQQEEKELNGKLQENGQKESILREKLHLSIQEEDLLSINTSIFMKEKIISAGEKFRRLKAKKIDLDELFNEEKQLLEETEGKIKDLEQQLLPQIEREALEEKIKDAETRHFIDQEFKQTEDRLEFLRKTQKRENEKINRKKVQDRSQFYMFVGLFGVLIAWGLWGSEWPLVVAGAIGIVFALYMFSRKPDSTDNEFVKEEIKALEEKKKRLVQKMNGTDFSQIAFIENRLAKDKEISEQLRHFNIQWKQQNEQYERVLLAFESWEKETLKHERLMIELGKELLLPKEIALSYLDDAFQLIEQLKELFREKKATLESHKSVTSHMNEMINAFNWLSTAFWGSGSSNLQETAYLLRKRLKQEMENQIKFEERTAKLIELEDEYKKLQIELEHFQSEQGKLLQLASVENLEQYRESGKLAEKKAKLDDELKDLRRQIKLSPLKEDEIDEHMNISNPNDLSNMIAKRLDELKEAIPFLQSRLAEKKYEIQVIEEGGTYAELLHTYKQKKAELEAEAKEWARFAMAKDILNRTIESFKKERLPLLLEKAEEFLCYLTDGNYLRIYPKKDTSGFLIESKERFLFEANELSQATTEQIYVSLRLALAETVYAKFPFPIIIDDSFVNFDHIRMEKIIGLLKSLPGRQIIFFTCHKHLLPYFSDEQIALVNKETSLPV
ncbi:AAA family ATPase [Bacillus sp. FJAT-29790]|uniref:ATP-binding protein n=1 Tax=Bacillus sp. FJAT-29790 TaxID=1895002 RepID=UPI001C23C0B1|nr:AAA family ATPase [Bacillus sp. FJAT-29790]MBU8880020.1 AAA family ATPase [Bacillus sp. FJAT-29790]